MKKMLLLSAIMFASLFALAGDTPVLHPHPKGLHPARHSALVFWYGHDVMHKGLAHPRVHLPAPVSLQMPDFNAADAEMIAQADTELDGLAAYRFVDFTKADAEMEALPQAREIVLADYRAIRFEKADEAMAASAGAMSR
jgi:hypothetical protein